MRKFLGKLGVIRIPLLHATTIFLMIFPAFCHAQTDCAWAQASVGSVSPTTLVAGQTTTVTITGTNLCWWTFYVTVATGSATYIDTDTNNEMVIDITPDASDPAGPATLWIVPSDCNTGTLGCFASIPIPIQIVSCTPQVTSLLPKTWFAGKSYNVIITGTGFNPTAIPGCPVTPVVARASSGSSISLSSVTVLSPTQITATVEPAASDPTGVAAITVGSSSTGEVTVRTQILGNQIQWTQNGTTNTISTDDGSTPPTQNAVVGQQIALTTTTPATTAYDGPTLSPTWTVGGTNIGGYPASTAGASVTPTTLNKSNLTTYWVIPGNAVPVKYQYCVNIEGANPINQCSLPANAAFNVAGPTSVTVTPSGQEFFIGDTPPAMNWGIQFNANATPPNGYTGTLTWIQLVQSFQYTWIYSDGDQPTTSAYTPGFDAGSPPSYPFATGAYAADGPLIGLESPPNNDEIEQTASGQYQMYLIWNPGIGSGTSASIPVPLGSLTWNIAGDVVWQAGTGTWVESTGDSNATTNKKFTTSSAYPTWQSPAAPRQ